MAQRSEPVNLGLLLATLSVILIVLGASLGMVLVIINYQGVDWTMRPADWQALRFTLVQATLSTLFSLAGAVPLARALMRCHFPGRTLFLSGLAIPFIMPTIIAVNGLLWVWGGQGLINRLIQSLGFDGFTIYGLQGVVLAHVFLNLPFATLVLLRGWASLPPTHIRLALQMDLSRKMVFKIIEWPMLRPLLPKLAAVIFLLCTTSFAIALTMGGGPKGTTLEVAIYEALRFSFDLPSAARLAIVQVILCLSIAFLTVQSGPTPLLIFTTRSHHPLPANLWDWVYLVAMILFLALPLLGYLIRAIEGIYGFHIELLSATLLSLKIASASSALALILALPVSLLTASYKNAHWVEALLLTALAISPFVIGTGLFILFFGRFSLAQIAFPSVVLANALMGLPFVLRLLLPKLTKTLESDGRLAIALGLHWRVRLRLILPRILPELALAASVTAALSLGDLGVITLFAPNNFETLPLLMYRLMGAYRMGDAACVGVFIILLALSGFIISELLRRHYDRSK